MSMATQPQISNYRAVPGEKSASSELPKETRGRTLMRSTSKAKRSKASDGDPTEGQAR